MRKMEAAPALEVVLQQDIRGELPLILDRHGNRIPCNETEARIAHLAEGLGRVPGVRFLAPAAGDAELDAAIHETHDAEYLAFLEQSSASLPEGEMILLDHPYLPKDIAADTPIIGGIYHTARESARTAITAARLAAQSGGMSYALCRPPGHHAGRAFLGGHCYINNGVLALQTVMRSGHGRVGLIDFDIHFGNGSSALIEGIPNAFFGSVHGATDISYPYIPTYPPNRMQAFVPFSHPPSPQEFVAAVAGLVRSALASGCTALVVSAGYDVVADDPHGIWTLDPSVLAEVGMVFAHAGVPICIVQEGGYNPERLAACAFHFASGLLCAVEQRAGDRAAHDMHVNRHHPNGSGLLHEDVHAGRYSPVTDSLNQA
ncbi:MAG TPA: hypothetical protein VHI13_04845 [Candidatus Kapabacteria bacterium]|nr:hypothetical protein [Candidatus Kapabacteria bacterium]